MLYAALIGIAVAFSLYVSVRLGFAAYIEGVYLTEENRTEREGRIVEELQSFADKNGISSLDTIELARWARSNKYLYIMIYKDDKLFFESEDYEDTEPPQDSENEGENSENVDTPPTSRPNSGITVELPTREDLIKLAEESGTHIITLKDTSVFVNMADYSEYFYYELSGILSVVIAMLGIVVVIMIYSNRVTGRITRLARNVAEVAEGNMDVKIEAGGNDEIYELAENVDNMRSSILQNLSKEKEAREANVELITSISHDIRTPLTVLLGYFDIMRTHNKDEVMRGYLDASERTALRMKELSDGLFNYFLLFGDEAPATPLDSYNAQTLIHQMVFEHVLLFRERGYTVEFEISDEARVAFDRFDLYTEAQSLTRIIENLMSNWSKYADKSYPVSIYLDFLNEKYKLKFTNKIHKASSAESNGIGVRTCRKLAERILADFSIEETDGFYSTTILFFTSLREESDDALIGPKSERKVK